MKQPVEEAGMELVCPYCDGWKVFPFTMGYYRCHSDLSYGDKCNKLVDPKDIVTRRIGSKGEKVVS